MTMKIVRSALTGIFLGVVIGIVVPTVARWNTVMQNKDQILADVGQQLASVFNMDDYDMGEVQEVFAISDTNLNPPSCNSLEDIILRFHVRANSDSTEDLVLKFLVRDAVLMEIGDELEGDFTRDEVLGYLRLNLDKIEEIAKEVIVREGYDYKVRAYISNDYFPIRQYGEIVLPAGNYQALRIDIGAAKGENFWCLLYPSVCYTIDSAAILSKEDEEEIAEVLDEEQYDRLFIQRDVEPEKIEVKFKFLEWLGL